MPLTRSYGVHRDGVLCFRPALLGTWAALSVKETEKRAIGFELFEVFERAEG